MLAIPLGLDSLLAGYRPLQAQGNSENPHKTTQARAKILVRADKKGGLGRAFQSLLKGVFTAEARSVREGLAVNRRSLTRPICQ